MSASPTREGTLCIAQHSRGLGDATKKFPLRNLSGVSDQATAFSRSGRTHGPMPSAWRREGHGGLCPPLQVPSLSHKVAIGSFTAVLDGTGRGGGGVRAPRACWGAFLGRAPAALAGVFAFAAYVAAAWHWVARATPGPTANTCLLEVMASVAAFSACNARSRDVGEVGRRIAEAGNASLLLIWDIAIIAATPLRNVVLSESSGSIASIDVK